MTPAQEQALKDARKILMQHFDAWLLTVDITNENLKSKIHHDWHGNIAQVVGLGAIAHERLIQYTSLRGGS